MHFGGIFAGLWPQIRNLTFQTKLFKIILLTCGNRQKMKIFIVSLQNL